MTLLSATFSSLFSPRMTASAGASIVTAEEWGRMPVSIALATSCMPLGRRRTEASVSASNVLVAAGVPFESSPSSPASFVTCSMPTQLSSILMCVLTPLMRFSFVSGLTLSSLMILCSSLRSRSASMPLSMSTLAFQTSALSFSSSSLSSVDSCLSVGIASRALGLLTSVLLTCPRTDFSPSHFLLLLSNIALLAFSFFSIFFFTGIGAGRGVAGMNCDGISPPRAWAMFSIAPSL
mmetsp:Transcript_17832/g.37060  ORF Transcript_17832/g.37060 Transcript_17832/m.37060 type:complete len:236 (-) Transcript_17832:734-1441(-)